jgi:GWxTD domain-containing protein
MILLGLLGGSSSLTAGDKLSKKDKKWLEQEVGVLITAEEAAIFEGLDSKDRQLFKEIFWARRDPNTMTPDNEFKEEYKKRVRMADDKFESQGRTGSATDMGEVFILLGRPEVGDELWKGGDWADDQLSSGRTPTQDQSWRYAPNPDRGIPNGLALQFRPHRGFGYRLLRTDEINAALDQVREHYVNPGIGYQFSDDGRLMKPPGRVDPTSAAKEILEDLLANKTSSQAIPLETEAYFFRATPDEVYVAVLLDIDGEKLTWDGDKAKATVFGIAETADGRQSGPVESTVELERDENGDVRYDVPFQLRPGSYSLYLGVLDDESKTVGTKILPVELPDFNKGGLASSSVVVFTDTKKVTEPPGTPGHAFQFGNTQFTLKEGETYKNTDTLHVWFFVYGFGLDESGLPSLSEECVFLEDGFRLAKTKAKPIRTEKDVGFIDTGFSLSSFEPGSYNVQITVTDNVAEETITKEIEFIVE